MDFDECKAKYFIVEEGNERAVIRDTPDAAERKRKKMLKYSGGKKIFIFKAEQRNSG